MAKSFDDYGNPTYSFPADEEREDIVVALDHVMRLMRRGGRGRGPGRIPGRGRAAGRILRTLEREGPMVTSELGVFLDVRMSSLNETLAKLEEEGLIRRTRSEMDGRMYLVQLSTKGRERIDEIHRERAQFEKRMAQILDEGERKEFVRLAEKLAAGLERMQEEG